MSKPEIEIPRLAEGVPGAYEALCAVLSGSKSLEYPLNLGAGYYFQLVSHLGWTGKEIAILYADKCQLKLARFLTLLIAIDRGYYPASKAREMGKDQFNQVVIAENVWEELFYLVTGNQNGNLTD